MIEILPTNELPDVLANIYPRYPFKWTKPADLKLLKLCECVCSSTDLNVN